MVSEEIIQAEKEYLVNVLGKELIDCEECDMSPKGYRKLAKKYWPHLYPNGRKAHVHHINFDHSDNRVCNLVVVTPYEHAQLHKMFDPNYDHKYDNIRNVSRPESVKQKISVTKQKNPYKHSDEMRKHLGDIQRGNKHTAEHNKHIGDSHIGMKYKMTKDSYPNRGYRKGKILIVVDGKRVWADK